MSNLIDKDALIAEIDSKIDILERNSGYTGEYGNAQLAVYDNMKTFIDHLEVKEVEDVDLEKEISKWWDNFYSGLGEDYPFERYSGHYIGNSTIIALVKHFFELGIQARKKE